MQRRAIFVITRGIRSCVIKVHRFRVQRFRVQGSEFRGSGFKVQSLDGWQPGKRPVKSKKKLFKSEQRISNKE
ncbi:hypothetical protein D1AOALGA4SA_4457 [Olavius algarvensis Delta 1 endosymbiont]|nr:hypothetical protein D1AOALGA4SA_4457 [Olavius algarvensis Delta 1 endosymbiont]